MANGFASAGGSLGLVILPPLLEILMDIYGWRGGLWIFGAMCFNSGFAEFLMKKGSSESNDNLNSPFSGDTKTAVKERNSEYRKISSKGEIEMEEQINSDNASIKGNKSTRSTDTDNKQLSFFKKNLKIFGYNAIAENRSFVFDLMAFTLLDMALYGWILFLFTFLTLNGLETLTASSVSALGGAGSLVGRMVFGPLLDVKLKCKNILARRLIAVSALMCNSNLIPIFDNIHRLGNSCVLHGNICRDNNAYLYCPY